MASPPFVQKVARTIERHGMVDPGDRVLVGLSGGADSVCLARVLVELGYTIGLAHLDHGLRGPASDQDARFVQDLARGLDVPLFLERLKPGTLAGNLEAAGRRARRQLFRRILESELYTKVALAHSRNDRAETLLLHLLRGAGVEGLVSMRPVSGWLIRPLIESGREEIEAHLTALGQDWRTDESNLDTRFRRNRMRHELIPRLAAGFNPNLVDTLARTAEILTDENVWMEREAARWVEAHFLDGREPADAATGFSIPDPVPALRVTELAGRPPALVRRVLRLALARAGSDLSNIGFDHVEQIRSLLARGKSGRVVELPGAMAVERSFDRIRFRPAGGSGSGAYEYRLTIPGAIEVPEAACRVEARVASGFTTGAGTAGRRVRADGTSFGPYVKIRNWNNGDTYEPVGLGRTKLKTLFQERRIPRHARRRWPVLIAGSSIVWAASFPVSREFAPTARSGRIIEFEALPTQR